MTVVIVSDEIGMQYKIVRVDFVQIEVEIKLKVGVLEQLII